MGDLQNTETIVGAEPTTGGYEDFLKEAETLLDNAEGGENLIEEKKEDSEVKETETKEDNLDGDKTPKNDESEKNTDNKNTSEDNKKEEKKEDKKTNDDDKKDKDNKEKEEIKVPLSRLKKEIEKKKNLAKKVEILEAKLQKELERIKELSEEEKEELENMEKIGIDTKKSKLEDMLEELKEELEEKDEIIKEYEKEVNEKKAQAIAKKIEQYKKEYDGSNGLPKFDIEELIEFSKEKNFFPEDPIELYNYKYQAEIFAKKFEKEAKGEPDKTNKKEVFKPEKQKKTGEFSDYEEFLEEAEQLLNSMGDTL